MPDNLGAYLVLEILVCLMPGPAVLFVVAQSAWRGPRAGVFAALGINAGNAVYYVLTATGLAALIASSALAFTVIKWGGAAYLAALGVMALVGSFRNSDAPSPVTSPRHSLHAFRDAFIVQLSNPKAILFFVALLPQFIDPDRNVALQVIWLCAIGMTVEMIVLTAYSLIGAGLSRRMAGPAFRKWFQRGVGGIFLSLSGLALLSRRWV